MIIIIIIIMMMLPICSRQSRVGAFSAMSRSTSAALRHKFPDCHDHRHKFPDRHDHHHKFPDCHDLRHKLPDYHDHRDYLVFKICQILLKHVLRGCCGSKYFF